MKEKIFYNWNTFLEKNISLKDKLTPHSALHVRPNAYNNFQTFEYILVADKIMFENTLELHKRAYEESNLTLILTSYDTHDSLEFLNALVAFTTNFFKEYPGLRDENFVFSALSDIATRKETIDDVRNKNLNNYNELDIKIIEIIKNHLKMLESEIESINSPVNEIKTLVTYFEQLSVFLLHNDSFLLFTRCVLSHIYALMATLVVTGLNNHAVKKLTPIRFKKIFKKWLTSPLGEIMKLCKNGVPIALLYEYMFIKKRAKPNKIFDFNSNMFHSFIKFFVQIDEKLYRYKNGAYTNKAYKDWKLLYNNNITDSTSPPKSLICYDKMLDSCKFPLWATREDTILSYYEDEKQWRESRSRPWKTDWRYLFGLYFKKDFAYETWYRIHCWPKR